VAAGRKAVIAKLLEGVDFSSLFQAELFEATDIEQEEELASFVRKLRFDSDPHPLLIFPPTSSLTCTHATRM
jgi:hypothetical protein